jgi:hypothetical protein
MDEDFEAKKNALSKLSGNTEENSNSQPKLGMGDLQLSDAVQRGYLPNEKDATVFDRMASYAKDFLYNKTPQEKIDEGLKSVIGSVGGFKIPKFNIKTLTDIERAGGKLNQLKSVLNERQLQDYVNYRKVPEELLSKVREIELLWKPPVK